MAKREDEEGDIRMIKVRPEQKSDIEAIKTLHDLAFKGENESRLIELIRHSEYFIPELSLVVENEKNELVGHILFSTAHIQTETTLVPTLALSPMAVHPDFQHKGIGSELVMKGILKSGELGFGHIVVLGHPNFYPKFGFIKSAEKEIKPPFPVPEEVFMVLELKEGSLEDISGAVVYPTAFSAVS